jgi:hypothetical protein
LLAGATMATVSPARKAAGLMNGVDWVIPIADRVYNAALQHLERFAVACTVWGDLFNRPDCVFVQSGKKRE